MSDHDEDCFDDEVDNSLREEVEDAHMLAGLVVTLGSFLQDAKTLPDSCRSKVEMALEHTTEALEAVTARIRTACVE